MTERLEFDIMELVDMLPTTDDGAAKLDFHEWQEPTACAASCAGMFLNASGVVRTPENSQKAIHEEIYDPHWGGDPPGGCPPERMVKFLSKFYERRPNLIQKTLLAYFNKMMEAYQSLEEESESLSE